MPRIRNYTSTVDMAKSVAAIEKRLVGWQIAGSATLSFFGIESRVMEHDVPLNLVTVLFQD